MKRLALVALLLAALPQPGGARSALSAGAAAQWGPNGNGTLKHEDDLQWLIFHDAKISANHAAGVYNARFSPLLLKMEGQHIVITGYVLAVDTAFASPHFVLTR